MVMITFGTIPERIRIRDDYRELNLAGSFGTIKQVDYVTRNVLVSIDDRSDLRKDELADGSGWWFDFRYILPAVGGGFDYYWLRSRIARVCCGNPETRKERARSDWTEMATDVLAELSCAIYAWSEETDIPVIHDEHAFRAVLRPLLTPPKMGD